MKQTAVEWLKEKTSDMTIHKTHLNDIISEWQDGYNVALEDVIKLLNQALEMEEGQHKETFKQSRQAKIFEKDMPPVWESFEEYYNETYKK